MAEKGKQPASVWLNGISPWAPGTQPHWGLSEDCTKHSRSILPYGKGRKAFVLQFSHWAVCLAPLVAALWLSTEVHRRKGTGVVGEYYVCSRIMRAQEFRPGPFPASRGNEQRRLLSVDACEGRFLTSSQCCPHQQLPWVTVQIVQTLPRMRLWAVPLREWWPSLPSVIL